MHGKGGGGEGRGGDLHYCINPSTVLHLFFCSSAVRDDPIMDTEHNLKYEPVLNRYRRADAPIDPNKKVCTLLLQVK